MSTPHIESHPHAPNKHKMVIVLIIVGAILASILVPVGLACLVAATNKPQLGMKDYVDKNTGIKYSHWTLNP